MENEKLIWDSENKDVSLENKGFEFGYLKKDMKFKEREFFFFLNFKEFFNIKKINVKFLNF